MRGPSVEKSVKSSPATATTVAATRFKRFAAKAGTGAASAFKEILVDIVSETAKKVRWS